MANDPRGSGSDLLRKEKFADLGSVHHGRKRVQPGRDTLREFYKHATPRLEFEPIWFDDALTMWETFADEARGALRSFADVSDQHPVWSNRPFKVFLYNPADVRRVVEYVARNPVKESLPHQEWSFLIPYNGWPHHKR